jgi:SNF2 family DNA or RNA helicase
VFVCTFGAGGVGLTLTAACTIILLDRPWTPGDALQAEDRVRRIGQTKAVTSIWIRAFEVDEQIDAMIEEKNQTSHAVVDGRDIAVSSSNDDRAHKPAPKISIFQLVKSIIPRNIDDFQTAPSCPGSSDSL